MSAIDPNSDVGCLSPRSFCPLQLRMDLGNLPLAGSLPPARVNRMRRREFIELLGAATLAPLGRARRPFRLGVHSGISADRPTESGGPFWVRRFYETLRGLGDVEGSTNRGSRSESRSAAQIGVTDKSQRYRDRAPPDATMSYR